MALMFSQNYSSSNNNNSGEGNNFGKDIFILKDDIKKDWMLYRASNNAEVKPYPVFDMAGNPCPVSTMDTTSPYSVLSDAFAVLHTVGYGGVDGKLAMIDYCSDVERYWPAESTSSRTPYQVLITGLRSMLPMRDSNSTKSGKPSPQSLLKVQKNISYSRETLLFRGVIFKHKGQPSTAKSATDGKLFKVVYYIPIASAVKSICAKFAELKDPRMAQDPAMIGNPASSAVSGLFEPDGLCLRLVKNGPNQSDEYRCEIGFDPTYTQTAMKFFNISDPSQYFPAVRTLFGPSQQLADILNIMTVEQMCNTIKQYFPISWVWYAWKDSPYAQFVTPDEQTRALQDPEMAVWFELPAAPTIPPQAQAIVDKAMVSYTPSGYTPPPTSAPKPAEPSYNAVYTQPSPSYPQAASGYPSYPATPPQPTPTQAASTPPVESYTQQAIADRLKTWESKYPTATVSDDGDGLKY